jgi:SecD/SecF fusion protein
VDVEPVQRRRGGGSITAPQDPTQVSRAEFDDMVKNLGIDEATHRSPAGAAAAAASGRPAGGRRARARAGGGDAPANRPPATGGTPQPPAEGGGEKPAPKKPRNKRHGRPR